MNRYLFDTHAVLWWLAGDRRFPLAQRRLLSRPTSSRYASSASVWEIATKSRLGRLPGAAAIEGRIGEAIGEDGFINLAITFAHAERAGSLPDPLRDPFDRILIAQALIEGLPIIGADEAFDGYGVRRIWG